MIDAARLIVDPLGEEPPPHDRRTHARFPASELDWIREVRLKYGPAVSLIDLSSGGVQLHTPVQLRPGATQVLEIVGTTVEAVPFQVLRCHIEYLSKDGPVYRGAGVFKRHVAVKPEQRRHTQSRRLDLTLKQLLQAQRRSAATPAANVRRAPARTLPGLLRSVQSAAAGQDPLSCALRHLLSELVPALDRGEPMAVLRARLEDGLRKTMPSLRIAVSSAPLSAAPGKETIYFAGAPDPNSTAIVNVELPGESVIPDWQFRLLQASGYLLELLSLTGAGLPTERARLRGHALAEAEAKRDAISSSAPPVEPPPESRTGWQKIVVRYRKGDLLKGFSHDFHPSRTQFSLWPSLDSLPNERVHIPTCLLKAVFFVRDFDGNPDYDDRRAFEPGQHRTGRRLEVTFDDGEVLVGSTLNYRPDGVGFFVEPADDSGNNQRVFAVSNAIRHVRFL